MAFRCLSPIGTFLSVFLSSIAYGQAPATLPSTSPATLTPTARVEAVAAGKDHPLVVLECGALPKCAMPEQKVSMRLRVYALGKVGSANIMVEVNGHQAVEAGRLDFTVGTREPFAAAGALDLASLKLKVGDVIKVYAVVEGGGLPSKKELPASVRSNASELAIVSKEEYAGSLRGMWKDMRKDLSLLGGYVERSRLHIPQYVRQCQSGYKGYSYYGSFGAWPAVGYYHIDPACYGARRQMSRLMDAASDGFGVDSEIARMLAQKAELLKLVAENMDETSHAFHRGSESAGDAATAGLQAEVFMARTEALLDALVGPATNRQELMADLDTIQARVSLVRFNVSLQAAAATQPSGEYLKKAQAVWSSVDAPICAMALDMVAARLTAFEKHANDVARLVDRTDPVESKLLSLAAQEAGNLESDRSVKQLKAMLAEETPDWKGCLSRVVKLEGDLVAIRTLLREGAIRKREADSKPAGAK